MPSLETLFRRHLTDLKTVNPNAGDIFVCPICFRIFTMEAIGKEELSIGDVWPIYIREKSGSQIASQQKVLLCKRCNSTAGSRGDRQMQLREHIKDAEKDGRIYGERRVQIISNPGEEPIDLNTTGTLNIGDIITSQFTFEIDKSTGKWKRNNPEAQERFLSLGTSESFTLIIHSHHELKSNLPEVGWITSAYLFAFYTFGYRYIFHSSLDTVRKYILKSFDGIESTSLEVPKLDNFGLTECKEHKLDNPEIGIIIPTDGKTWIHIQISFLDYHTRLPFHFVPTVLQAMILRLPRPKVLGPEAYLYSPIVCNKSDGHECIWDYVLGKPINN